MSQQDHTRGRIEQVLRTLCPPREGGARPGAVDPAQEVAAAFIRFMDEMPGGFLIYHADRDEEIIYANLALLRIFQCGSMEQFRALTGNSFRGMVHPDDLETVESSIRTQIAASQFDLDYVEYRIRASDGSIRWVEDYGHFVHTAAAGDIFYVFLGDATEKRRRFLTEKTQLVQDRLDEAHKLQTLIQEYDEERSLLNEEYLRQLEVIEGLSINYESICYVDLDADLVVPYRLSHRTSVLFYEKLPDDRSYTQYAACYLDTWVHPDDRELVAQATAPGYIREKLAGSRTYYFNYRVLVDGEVQYLQLRLVSVGHEGGPCQVVLGYRRVDEEIQQQMEQQALLAEALDKANSAITSKNAFLSNMSHDMRTPLNAIFGLTSLARRSLENPAQAAAYLERAEESGRKLLDMIEKVLEVSDQASASGAEEECDLREIAQRIFDFLHPQAQEKDITFRLDCGGLRHSAVYADRDKLRQLLLYLSNNAVTYTNPGGQVSITVTQGAELPNGCGVYLISVEDSGIGISPDYLKQVFEPFSREKNTTLSGVHGVGLGLTIAKNIVDLMGGAIDVHSAVGQGSTFTVTLTLRIQPRPGAGPPAAPARDGVLRILMAEDNDINREIAQELLGQMGFVVDAVENGRLAVDQMERSAPGHYDVILMDLQMPVLDGWQAARAIRALPDPAAASTPIIALSANVLENDRQRSQESGINFHLPKPIDMPLLLHAVEELTGKQLPC